MRRLAPENVEREREKRVSGKDRRRLIESAVHRRLSAAQIVVVHCRKIVMHERIAMHAFESGGGGKRFCLGNAEQRRTLNHKKWPQAFSPRSCVAHRGEQPRGPENFTRLGLLAQKRTKKRFRRRGNGVEPLDKMFFGRIAQGARALPWRGYGVNPSG